MKDSDFDDKPDQFEKDIPVPKKRSGRPAKIDWRAMEVGDSIYVDEERAKSALSSVNRYQQSAYSTVWIEDAFTPGGRWAITGKKQFTSRKEGNGVRIWRTKDKKAETVEADGILWVKDLGDS